MTARKNPDYTYNTTVHPAILATLYVCEHNLDHPVDVKTINKAPTLYWYRPQTFSRHVNLLAKLGHLVRAEDNTLTLTASGRAIAEEYIAPALAAGLHIEDQTMAWVTDPPFREFP